MSTVPEQTTDMDEDHPFPELAARVRDFTMISDMNLYAAFNAVRYVVRAGIPGDVVECGVWKGGAAALMSSTALHYEACVRRTIWLYDTFTGMTQPSDTDIRHTVPRSARSGAACQVGVVVQARP